MIGFKTQTLQINGMHCDTCVQRVSKALGTTPGVRVESVSVGEAHLLAEPECESAIRQALEEAGFTLTSMHGEG